MIAPAAVKKVHASSGTEDATLALSPRETQSVTFSQSLAALLDPGTLCNHPLRSDISISSHTGQVLINPGAALSFNLLGQAVCVGATSAEALGGVTIQYADGGQTTFRGAPFPVVLQSGTKLSDIKTAAPDRSAAA